MARKVKELNFYVYESEGAKVIKRWVCDTNAEAWRLLETLSAQHPDRSYVYGHGPKLSESWAIV